ncbi:MAG: DUF3800 domain-containing protein [bacterium]
MFIYIDETFNLEKGTKNQFMAVAGFSTANPGETAKWYKKVKRKALPASYPKGEIKSSNALSDLYILPYIFSPECPAPEITVFAASQSKNLLSQKYYYKSKLVYDRLYINLVKKVLLESSKTFKREKVTIVTLDSFKTKLINKEGLSRTIETELKLEYPESDFRIDFGTSEEANLQIADQICGIIHSHLYGNKKTLTKLGKKVNLIYLENKL